MSTIGEKILSIRQKKGMTQKEFAEAIKLTQGRLSEIEKGKNNPSFETLQAIKTNLNIDINSLVDDSVSEVEYSITNISEECNDFSNYNDSIMSFIKLLLENMHIGFEMNRNTIVKLIHALRNHVDEADDPNAIYTEDLNEFEMSLVHNYRMLSERDQGKVEQFIQEILKQYDKNKRRGKSSTYESGEEAAAKELA